jgi:serine/threonine protein kinase
LAAKELRTEFAPTRAVPAGKALKFAQTTVESAAQELTLMLKVEPELCVYDTINHAGKLYIVMDLMIGDMRFVADRLPTDVKVLFGRTLLLTLSASLSRCHALGYIHRDVKLENCLVRRDGKLFLADYGLAKALQAGQCSGNGGTYFAPEQFPTPDAPETLRIYDAKVDTWSLGVTFASLHAPWDTCPLGALRRLKREQQFDTIARLLQDYRRWHAGLLVDGKVDLSRIRTDRFARDPLKGYDTYFGALAKRDAFMCQFVLQSMLTPNPADRADMAAVNAYATLAVPTQESALARRGSKALQRVVSRVQAGRAKAFRMLRDVQVRWRADHPA